MISNFQSVFHSIENGYDLRYYREGYEKKHVHSRSWKPVWTLVMTSMVERFLLT